MIFKCIQCGKKIKGYWNPKEKRYEPESNYWKSSPPYHDDILEVYCSPQCSLNKHEGKEFEK